MPKSITMDEHIVNSSRISTMLYGFMKVVLAPIIRKDQKLRFGEGIDDFVQKALIISGPLIA